MSKFILIDHSLNTPGGHHFECSRLILAGAEEAGFETITGAHVDFQPSPDWPERWPVLPVFHQTAYTRHAVLTGQSREPVNPFRPFRPDRLPPAWWSSWRRLKETGAKWCRRGRLRKRLSQMTEDARQFWDRVHSRPGDLAYLMTVSDFDMVWLCEFLRTTPSTQDVAWHLHFHNNFLEGRDPEYSRQSLMTDLMREHFELLLRRLPSHEIVLHCTTEPLARQFDLLRLGKTRVLPCPANPLLWQAVKPPRAAALRVVCAGSGRDEKGWRQLTEILKNDWHDLFLSGRCQLLVQSTEPPSPTVASPAAASPVAVSPVVASSGASSTVATAATASAVVSHSPYKDVSGNVVTELTQSLPSSAEHSPLRRVPHPLPPREYLDLIRETDIGLFLYDSRRYFSRYSAVLVEMLCAGAPVVVPAASWLASQIEHENESYLDQLYESADARHADAAPIRTFDLLPRGERLSSAGDGRESHFDGWVGAIVPARSGELLARVDWLSLAAQGEYVRVDCLEFNGRGERTSATPVVVGRRADGSNDSTPVMFQLAPATTRVELRWSNIATGGEGANRTSLANPPASSVARVSAAHASVAHAHVAHDESVLETRLVDLRFLPRIMQTADNRAVSRPLGKVGLVAADSHQVGRLLRDLSEHYEHYRRHAEEFAVRYRQKHSAARILEQLRQASHVETAVRSATDARNSQSDSPSRSRQDEAIQSRRSRAA